MHTLDVLSVEQGGYEDFCLDINEDRMVVELKKQGCQALYVARCFWIFTYVVWICILSF